MSCVYWIRLPTHNDINKQGYVGKADDFEYRMKRHLNTTGRTQSHFGRAIRLYGWNTLIKTIIFEGSSDECFEYEKKLRMNCGIGWNEAQGGKGDTSLYIDYDAIKHKGWNYNNKGSNNSFFGKKHTKEVKDRQMEIQAKAIIHTPTGMFYGFNALAKYLNVHKVTAKKIAIKKGWKIEIKQKGYGVNH